MKRLLLLVEGQTEYRFSETVLCPHFLRLNLYVEPRVLVTGTSSRTGGKVRGGVSKYGKIEQDTRPLLHQCRPGEVWLTTMFDLYRLPVDFPGLEEAPKTPVYNRVAFLEEHFRESWRDKRSSESLLIPYIQLHEFETLLLCGIEYFKESFPEDADQKKIERLETEITNDMKKNGYSSLEEINDRIESAPSKRIIKYLPDYENLKETAGATIAGKIGLPRMRENCPHFDEWITGLETLAKE